MAKQREVHGEASAFSDDRRVLQEPDLSQKQGALRSRLPRHLPRSVLGPARSCLNLSSREASLSLNAELLRVLGSDVPRSATVAECGRDWDLCRGAVLLVLSAERETTEGEDGLWDFLTATLPLRRPPTCCTAFPM